MMKNTVKILSLAFMFLMIFGCEVANPLLVTDVATVPNDSVEMLARNNAIRAELYTGHNLVWSESLALSAQAHADKLAKNNTFEHSGTSNGENLFASSKSTGYVEAVNAWYDEKKDYTLANNTCKNNKVCGHYTQLIWQDTSEVGCAKSSSASWTTIVVCQYNPPGNYIGEAPF